MKLNTQPPEKRATGDGTVIAVNSLFHTIQGEGPFAGTPAIFIRLAGCNLQCPMCDTEYSKRGDYPIEEIVKTVYGASPIQSGTLLVVITGGEPFRQKLGPLATALLDYGYRVQVETNGSYYEEGFPYERVTIVCSPKTAHISRKLVPHIDAFKYVARAGHLADDGLPKTALDHPSNGLLYRPGEHVPSHAIYLQPADEQNHYPNKLNMDAVVASCLENGYRLCIQTHKIIGVP